MNNWYSTERIAADVQAEHRRAARAVRLLQTERHERPTLGTHLARLRHTLVNMLQRGTWIVTRIKPSPREP